MLMRHRTLTRTVALGAVAGLVALTGATSAVRPGAATAAAPRAESRMLGLPPLALAQQYVLAPSSRTVRPERVTSATRVNLDFVTASSLTSETQAHDLDARSSDVTEVGGHLVRRAGVGRAGAEFSYRLRVPEATSFRLRVEEAGSADAAYEVLVGGEVVRTRSLDLYAAQGRPVGLTHFEVRVPGRLVGRKGARVTFRNAANPGDGARIAGVWASTGSGADDPAYGGTVEDPRAAITGGAGSTRLSSDLFGRPYAVYDFGREVGGAMRFQVDGVRGNPRLGLAFSESDTFMTTASDYSQDPSGVATETHYFRVRDAGELRDPVIRGGFRYLMVFLDSPGRVDLSRLRLRFTGDSGNRNPADYAGSFLSSDEQLTELWYAGAYTTQLSTIASDTGRPYPATPGPVANDVTVAGGRAFLSDGAKRDRYDWGGDNVVSNVVAYLTTGREAPARNALDWFAANPSPEGQVPGVYLPEPAGFTYSWGEYAAWWMQNYWNHYLHTGDRAYLGTWFDTLVGNVEWVESRVGEDGLWDVPGGAGGHWGYNQAGRETYNNLVYVHTLTSAVAAAEAMGRSGLAEQWAAQAERTGRAVDASLWDEEVGAYREIAGSEAHPLDANVMAVLSGVASPERTARVLDFIERELRTPYGDVAVDAAAGTAVPRYIAPFVSGQELLALASAGDAVAAMDVLRRTWGHMLEGDTSGTFWETVSPEGELGLGSYTSMSHGWAASPTSFLTQETLGVSPTGPGYTAFEVAPQPAGTRWAQGEVPTPQGTLRTAWKDTADGFSLVVRPPAGTTYAVEVPGGEGDAVTTNGDEVPDSDDSSPDPATLRLEGLSGSTIIHVTSGS